MGDPKKIKSKYSGPRHPWEKARIEEEKSLIKEYGLKNKKEIWRMNSILTNFKDQAKRLTAVGGTQEQKEHQQLSQKLASMDLLSPGAPLVDALAIGLRQVLDRRLQSMVYKRDLARSMKQARQLIVHRHIKVNGNKVTFPSYIVKTNEEITFSERSALKDESHPERKEKKKETSKEEKKKEEKEAKEKILAYSEEEILDEDAAALAEIKKSKGAEEKEEKNDGSEEIGELAGNAAEEQKSAPGETSDKPSLPEKSPEEKTNKETKSETESKEEKE